MASASTAMAGPVYFQVAELPGSEFHGDSFVIPLELPDQIAHARDLIRHGPEGAASPIVFATIAKGPDQINRDLNQPDRPLWDWHVTSVDGFGDIGIELLDGWPTFVQSDVDGWIANTNTGSAKPGEGRIGFWSYTVVRELTGYPQDVPVIPLPAAVPVAAVLLWFTARRGKRWVR
jgi:hypothetical protein